MSALLAVACGGALGASARYLMMIAIGTFVGSSFPIATLAVNTLGSFLLGALVEFGAMTGGLTKAWRSFLAVGVLGGFTTFSTFALDVLGLTQRANEAAAALYVFLSILLSVGAMVAGFRLMRYLLA